MALLAESLVEEWLNRQGFFTIRGVKRGLGEIDLLAVRHEPQGPITGWHVEVQASFRPIGYISKLTPAIANASGGSRTSARTREGDAIDACARAWIELKFSSPKKRDARESLWPGVTWSYHLVHAVVREPRELEAFRQAGVECHPFIQLLDELTKRGGDGFSGSAGGDLADVVTYFSTRGERPGRVRRS